MYKKYDQYLSSNFSADFWSDEGINQAASFVNDFDGTDWDSLCKSINEKSSQWLVRCAETLGDKIENKSFDALILLVQVEDKEVQLASVDSINSLVNMGFDISKYGKSIKPILNRLNANAVGIAKIVIENLERKIIDQ